MVYLDSKNPSAANNIDHIALFVKTDEFSTFVESTAKENGLDDWDDVSGWYFEV